MINFFEARADVQRFERVLFVGRGKRGQARGDKIHQAARLVDVQGYGGKLVGKRGRTGDDLLEQRQHVALEGFDFGAVWR